LPSVDRFRALLLVVGCTVFGVAFSFVVIRGYRDFALAGTMQKGSVERAIALEPRDAHPYNVLCRYIRDNEIDPSKALPYCKRSVQLNPYDSEYWLDLAETSYEAGNASEQRQAVERAVAVDPKTPQVAWNAANFYLLQGEVEPAVNLFAAVLKGDPGLVPLTLKTSWQVLGNVDPVLRILPPDPSAYLQFLALLVAQDHPQAAAKVWSRLIDLNLNMDYHDALFYVDQLLVWRDVDAAQQAWKQIATRSPGFADYGRGDQNLMVNGSFEEDILKGGFDWRINPQGTAISVDEETVKDGHRALLISYSVPVLDAGLSQLVPVEPDTAYTATAWIKSNELQTANGPRLSVFDAYSGASFGASEPTSYTTDWRQVELQFRTGPDTRLVSIRLSRDRQDTVIRGRLWIDDVQLRKSAAKTGIQ
jgi:tetratricopeptide (TPR) repeat protein